MNKPRESQDSKTQNSENPSYSNPVSVILDLQHLNENEQAFFTRLYNDPRISALQNFWSIKPAELKMDLVQESLYTLSTGEAHLLRFLAGVWLGSNTFDFDLLQATRDLDHTSLSFIQDWMADPYFV